MPFDASIPLRGTVLTLPDLLGQQMRMQDMIAQQQRMRLEEQHGALYAAQARRAMQQAAQEEEAQRTRAAIIEKLAVENPALANLLRLDPATALKRMSPEKKLETIYDPQGRETKAWMAPGQAPEFVGGSKSNLPTGMEMVGGRAGYVPGLPEAELAKKLAEEQALFPYKRATAAAGAANIAPKIEVKTGESIAGQIGPMLKSSREGALAAVRLADSSNRILDAAANKEFYAGPGANIRMKAAQIADTLGVGGETTQEKILNTRDVIRGLSEQAVAARSQLGSQAQISNAEQALLTKATSGDIGDLTPAEIVKIATLGNRLAGQMYGLHEEQMGNIKQDPNLSGMAKFYSAPPLPRGQNEPSANYTEIRQTRDGRLLGKRPDGRIEEIKR